MVFDNMKIPTEPEGNGYYNQDAVIRYGSDNSDVSSDDDEDSPTLDGDFSEYLWMENIEEFDNEVMKQLEEEELMQQCIEAMLEDERDGMTTSTTSNGCNNPWDRNPSSLITQVEGLSTTDDLAKDSKLNPEATEFVPRQREAAPAVDAKA